MQAAEFLVKFIMRSRFLYDQWVTYYIITFWCVCFSLLSFIPIHSVFRNISYLLFKCSVFFLFSLFCVWFFVWICVCWLVCVWIILLFHSSPNCKSSMYIISHRGSRGKGSEQFLTSLHELLMTICDMMKLECKENELIAPRAQAQALQFLPQTFDLFLTVLSVNSLG